MGKRIFVLLALAALSLVPFGMTGTLPASAQPACPSPVTSNTTLTSDCTPPPGGIVIAADKVHLNGTGHKVLCTPVPGSVGVNIPSHKDVHLVNMTILHCGFGIVITGGGDNKITHVNVFNNPACPLGFGGAGATGTPPGIPRFTAIGLHVTGSNGNHIESSTFSCNRIGVELDSSKDNTIDSSEINKNIDPVFCGGVLIGFLGSSTGNVIRSSQLLRNGDFAVETFPGSVNNTIQSSTLNQTSFPNPAGPPSAPFFDAPAVLLGSSHNTVKANTADENGFGIELSFGSTDNTVGENEALGNTFFDLADGNPGCDMNTWRNNRFVTRNQTCIH